MHFRRVVTVARWLVSDEFGRTVIETVHGCLSPVQMPLVGPVSCRKCVNCEAARKSALVGRLLAEQRSAGWSGVATLTYGQDDYYRPVVGGEGNALNAVMLTYMDPQVWLKRLRKAMPKANVRYFIAGEYGEAKGRAHWHVALFADHEPPNTVYDERYIHWIETPDQARERGSRYRSGKPLWSKGFSFWEVPNEGSWAYVAKYALKGASDKAAEQSGEHRQRVQHWSAKPPIGAEWLTGVWARLHVEGGLSPQEPRYEFGDVLWHDGRHRRFFMRSAAVRRRFYEAFVWQWRREHGNDNWPYSDVVDAYLEDEEYRRFRRRWSLPDVPDFLFDERFYMARFDRPGHWLPLLKDGGRSRREAFFPELYFDSEEEVREAA